jgi:hypothetical protein
MMELLDLAEARLKWLAETHEPPAQIQGCPAGKPFPGKSQWLEDQKLHERMSAYRFFAQREPVSVNVEKGDLLAILDMAQRDKTQPPDTAPVSMETLNAIYHTAVEQCPPSCKTKHLEGLRAVREAVERKSRLPTKDELEFRRVGEAVRIALDAAGAPQYNPLDETEGWGFARRIAWLHTEKGLADARLTALQKVWQEKLDAMTQTEHALTDRTHTAERAYLQARKENDALMERAKAAERSRDEFQKRLEPLHGKPAWTQHTGDGFIKDLQHLINYHSLENGSNTPDWILAEYLSGCLVHFNTTMRSREKYYGREIHEKGGPPTELASGLSKAFDQMASEMEAGAGKLSGDISAKELPPFPYGMGMNEVQKAEALTNAGWMQSNGKWRMPQSKYSMSKPEGETLEDAYQIHAKMMEQPPWERELVKMCEECGTTTPDFTNIATREDPHILCPQCKAKRDASLQQ